MIDNHSPHPFPFKYNATLYILGLVFVTHTITYATLYQVFSFNYRVQNQYKRARKSLGILCYNFSLVCFFININSNLFIFTKKKRMVFFFLNGMYLHLVFYHIEHFNIFFLNIYVLPLRSRICICCLKFLIIHLFIDTRKYDMNAIETTLHTSHNL